MKFIVAWPLTEARSFLTLQWTLVRRDIKQWYLMRWEGNCAESSAIITCQMEEIVPLKQGTHFQMTYAYLHLHIPSIHLFSCTHTLSSLLPPGHFLLSIHVSFSLLHPPPADLFRSTRWNPLALLTCIKRLHSKRGFHWGSVGARSLLTCRLYSQPLSRTCMNRPHLSDSR